jgi:hypothetical protein
MTDLSVVNDEEGEEECSAHRHGCVGEFPAHKHLSTMTCRQNTTLFFARATQFLEKILKTYSLKILTAFFEGILQDLQSSSYWSNL